MVLICKIWDILFALLLLFLEDIGFQIIFSNLYNTKLLDIYKISRF